MGDVIPFKRSKLSVKHRGTTLCKRGFHKWETLKDRQFDVKHGKLVTVYRCARCGAIETKAH